jgi:sterol desaturase/sphingolipid hydroxylase (fatty acid hydroxylase superfamily)
MIAFWIFGAVLVPVAVSGSIIAAGWVAERARPAATCPASGVLFNLFYLAPYSLLHAVSVPAVAGVAVATTNALGGGLVRLPSSGWNLVWAVALYALTVDFGEYGFHRAQHRFRVLWAMHSLHHSDGAVNVSTTQRHFWAEQAIKSATIYLDLPGVCGERFRFYAARPSN